MVGTHNHLDVIRAPFPAGSPWWHTGPFSVTCAFGYHQASTPRHVQVSPGVQEARTRFCISGGVQERMSTGQRATAGSECGHVGTQMYTGEQASVASTCAHEVQESVSPGLGAHTHAQVCTGSIRSEETDPDTSCRWDPRLPGTWCVPFSREITSNIPCSEVADSGLRRSRLSVRTLKAARLESLLKNCGMIYLL